MSLNGKVTVVGAGFYGSTTAQRLAEYNVFETVVLTDILEGRPEGLALDLNQSRPIEGFETRRHSVPMLLPAQSARFRSLSVVGGVRFGLSSSRMRAKPRLCLSCSRKSSPVLGSIMRT